MGCSKCTHIGNMDYDAVMETLEKDLSMNSSGISQDCSCFQSICSTQDFSSMSQNVHFAVQVCFEL